MTAIIDAARADAGRAGRDHPAAGGHGRGRALRGGEDHAPAGQGGRPERVAAADDAGRAGRAGRPGRRRHPAVRATGPQRPGQLVLASNPASDMQLGLAARHEDHGDQRARAARADRRRRRHLGHQLGGRLGSARRDRQRCARRARPAAAQMLYRFRSAGTAAAIRADIGCGQRGAAGRRGDRHAVLPGRQGPGASRIAPFVPFLVAFGVIGPGHVGADRGQRGQRRGRGRLPPDRHPQEHRLHPRPGRGGLHRPGRGARRGRLRWAAWCSGTCWPCRCSPGPRTPTGSAPLGVPSWVDVAVPAGDARPGRRRRPAARAAGRRLSAVQAIAAGRAPRTGRGYAAHRLLGRLRLPRPVTIGLAAPFARPARTAVTLVAILLGATAVTFAVGLTRSLNRVVGGLSHATRPAGAGLPQLAERLRHRRRAAADHRGGAAGPAGNSAATWPRPTSRSAWPG